MTGPRRVFESPAYQARLAHMAETEKAAVKRLGDQIGFGRLMQLAEECWREVDGRGSEHTTGPCAALLVKCGCREVRTVQLGEYQSCDWCCGAGRVTEKVKAAMMAEAAIEMKTPLQPTAYKAGTYYWVESDHGSMHAMHLNVDMAWKLGDKYIPHAFFMSMMKGKRIVEAIPPQ